MIRFKYPNTLLALILVAVPLAFSQSIMWGYNVPKEFALQIGVLLAVMMTSCFPRITIRIQSMDILLLMRFSFIFVLALVAQERGFAIQKLWPLLFLTLLFFTVRIWQESDDPLDRVIFPTVVSSVTAIALLLSIYGIIQYLGFDPFKLNTPVIYESEVVGTFANANGFGGFMAALFPFIIAAYMLAQRPVLKIVAGCTAVISLIVITLTLSRGAWIGFIAGLIVLGLPLLCRFYQQHLAGHRLNLIAAATLALVLAGAGSYGLYQLNPASARGRLFLWQITANMIKEHPVSGIGYNRYGVEYLNYQAQYFDETDDEATFDMAANIKQPHNEYLQAFAETGVLGGLLFLSIIALPFMSIRRILARRIDNREQFWRQITPLASIAVIATHALVDSPLHTMPTSLIFYLSLALLVSADDGAPVLRTIDYEVKLANRAHWAKWIIPLIAGTAIIILANHCLIQFKGYSAWLKGQNSVAYGNWYQGIRDYEAARLCLPHNPELAFHLGAAYAYTNQPEQALQLLGESESNFNDTNLSVVKGSALAQIGDYSGAKRAYRTALRMYPKLLTPRLYLAQMYLTLGMIDDATLELTLIQHIEPKMETYEIKRIKQTAHEILTKLNSAW